MQGANKIKNQNIYKIKCRKIKMRGKTHYIVMGEEFPNGSHTTVTPLALVKGHTGISNAHRIKAKADGEHW